MSKIDEVHLVFETAFTDCGAFGNVTVKGIAKAI